MQSTLFSQQVADALAYLLKLQLSLMLFILFFYLLPLFNGVVVAKEFLYMRLCHRQWLESGSKNQSSIIREKFYSRYLRDLPHYCCINLTLDIEGYFIFCFCIYGAYAFNLH